MTIRVKCGTCGKLRNCDELRFDKGADGLKTVCIVCLCGGDEDLARIFMECGEAIKAGAEEIKTQMDR